MQYRPPNANQEVSNKNHFGSVSYSLGQLTAASHCMASLRKYTNKIDEHETSCHKQNEGELLLQNVDLYIL